MQRNLNYDVDRIFATTVFTAAKMGQELKWPSVDEWIKKMWFIGTMGCESLFEKQVILSFVMTWMNKGCNIPK